MKNKKTKRIINKVIRFIVSSIIFVIMVYPLWWLFTSVFKDADEINRIPPTLLAINPTFENIRIIMDKFDILGNMFFNSLYVAITIPILQTIVCVLAAYAFAKLKFKGSSILFLIFMSSMMIPPQLTMLTNFLTITKTFKLMNNLLSLQLLGVFSAFAIFMLRQHFLTMPKELEEAAMIDGCGPIRTFLHVSLPLAKPIIMVNFILCFNAAWGDFFTPMNFLRDTKKMTLAIGMTVINGAYSVQSPGVMVTALAFSTLPSIIVFFIFRKQLIAGISSTGIKM